MGITFILSSVYMWWTRVPDFPLGAQGVRGWLILRAAFGFGGLYCLYCEFKVTENHRYVSGSNFTADSVHYLPLAEATVFRFLVPIVTAWACSVFLGQKFTRKELIAGLVALIGVIIIAHPPWLFGEVHDELHPKKPNGIDKVTPAQRFIAIVVSILGVAGASGAYTTIRVIGDRAHALMSVNYFALLATVGSTIALLAIPGISFQVPQSARDWTLLISMGVLGFVLQFLLTAGLQLDKSSKATSMLYVQIIFALALDWGIWGVIPGAWSMFGGSIVICSTLWSALQKPHGKVSRASEPDEESTLLGAETDEDEAVVRRASISA
jgi:drug/metabolite transporter (DMT)-like permease